MVSNLCNDARRLKGRSIEDADDANRPAERLKDELFEFDRLRCDIEAIEMMLCQILA